MKYILILLLLAGCSFDALEDAINSAQQASEEPQQPAEPEVVVIEDTLTLPAQEFATFGENGNLWKPVSDTTSSGAGNLVVLFSSDYDTQFASCTIPLKSGGESELVCIDDQPWTQVPFSCFSNGDRQTWRASFKCGDAAAAQVTCIRPDGLGTITFSHTGGVCERR